MQANVESRPVWKPMHLQPLYAGCECYGGAVAEDLFRRGICLPSSSSLSEQEQLHVINAVRRSAGAGSYWTRSVQRNVWHKPEIESPITMRTIREFVDGCKSVHRIVVWAAQIGIFALSTVAAFLLRFDFSLPSAYLFHLAYALPIWIMVKSAVFRVGNLDRGWWRYVSLNDLVRIVVGNFAGSALGCVLILVIAPGGFPRSIYLLDLILCFLGTAGLRVVVRMTAEATSHGAERRRGKEHADLWRGRLPASLSSGRFRIILNCRIASGDSWTIGPKNGARAFLAYRCSEGEATHAHWSKSTKSKRF